MRVVLDTNVVVSSYLVHVGPSARILSAWRNQQFELVVSSALLAEYERALNYDRVRRRHGLSAEQIARNIEDLGQLAILVEPETVPAIIAADPDDDQVLAAAVAGEAEFIVSGDRHLLDLRQHAGIRVLSPAAFATLLDAGT